MRTVWIVLRHEFLYATRKRSFWFMTFLFPVLILAMSFGSSFLGDIEGDSLSEALQPQGQAEITGYVDQAGLVQELPPDVPAEVFPGFADVEQARSAVQAGEIGGYFIIEDDYLQTGAVTLVQDEFSALSAASAGPLFEYVMNYALVGDAAEAAALVEPVGDTKLEQVQPAGATRSGEASEGAAGAEAASGSAETDPSLAAAADLVPFGVLFILFFVITTSSSYLLQSVSAEKENRTAEVLLVSVKPRELMLGKVLGLGAVALLQITVWIGGGLLVLYQYVGIPDLAAVGLSGSLVAWLLAFLALGYVAYGALVAALGAMVPSQREGTQLIFIVLFPLILPVWFNYALTTDPDGWMAVALSLFPLSAPVAMLTRLAAGSVPLWQPLVALGGLALIAYLFVLVGARLFRADTLLSTQSLRWGRLVDEFRRNKRA